MKKRRDRIVMSEVKFKRSAWVRLAESVLCARSTDTIHASLPLLSCCSQVFVRQRSVCSTLVCSVITLGHWIRLCLLLFGNFSLALFSWYKLRSHRFCLYLWISFACTKHFAIVVAINVAMNFALDVTMEIAVLLPWIRKLNEYA